MALRNTIQRKLVFEAIKKLKHHATANEIFFAISHKHPTISRATVYRNLNILSDENKIKRVHVPNSADYYDPIFQPHHHARCQECGQLFDLEIDDIAPAIQKAASDINFNLDNFDLMLNGVCNNCANRLKIQTQET